MIDTKGTTNTFWEGAGYEWSPSQHGHFTSGVRVKRPTVFWQYQPYRPVQNFAIADQQVLSVKNSEVTFITHPTGSCHLISDSSNYTENLKLQHITFLCILNYICNLVIAHLETSISLALKYLRTYNLYTKRQSLNHRSAVLINYKTNR